MIQRIALLLLLCCASLPVLAGEGRMDIVEVEAGCQADCGAVDVAAGAVGDEHGISPGDASDGAPAAEAGTASPATSPESTSRPPRMHNLIPGMFR